MTLAALLSLALERQASDLHLSAGLAPMLRIHGQLQPLDLAPLSPEAALALVHEMLTEPQRQTLAHELDVDGALDWPGLGRFRLNAFMHQRGAGAVLRRIATRVPALRRRSRTPVAASSRKARLTVARAQPNSRASASSVGISAPGPHSRVRMRRRTSAWIASHP
jgi:twitching motility protein PilT